jgi:phage terminase large subunit-like protein
MRPLELMPHQQRFVYSPKRIVVMLCGRGAGKSVAGAFLIANRITHGGVGLALAPTYRMLESVLIAEVRKTFDRYGWKYRYLKQDKVLILYQAGKELGKIYFRSCENPDSIRGLTEINFLVIDEAAYCDREAYEIAIATMRGENVRKPRQYLVSTPRGRGNWATELAMSDDPEVEYIQATSYENVHLDESFVEDLRKQYGDEFAKQEIEGAILDASSACVFTTAQIDGLDVVRPIAMAEELVFGLDVGGEGDDYSVLCVRRGMCVQKFIRRKTPTQTAIECMVLDAAREHGKPDKIFVDCTGIGAFVPKSLSAQFSNVEVVGVHFGSAPYADAYKNKRTELYFDLRDKIQEGLFFGLDVSPEHKRLIVPEMYATEYFIDNKQKISLHGKSDIKKQLSRSPDLADSLALSCARGSTVTKATLDALSGTLKKSLKAFPRR